ncbi:hypothetical protein DL546_003103 [Coniochaeta pulveracea]|uniref:Peptidase M24 domain-containing protein n=1 Tax=Coniochaeta pulveracea TaxID=177199 RepID=A0A420XXI2_9PEZI|nr:hypothetical protein DL546_003103 [Coniochaeta pulveracea]
MVGLCKWHDFNSKSWSGKLPVVIMVQLVGGIVLSLLSAASATVSVPTDELTWPHLPKYFHLPPLREQAAIQDAWTKERRDSIPALLQKYNVSGWLISQREYAEDTLFWSLKPATAFAARRRTTELFLAVPDAKNNKTHHSWITNTPETDLWPELKCIIQDEKLHSIAINQNPDVAFASGMHAGELRAMSILGKETWKAFVPVPPMLPIELVGTMVEGKALWYRKLMSTAWAMISEGFSERVIAPGESTTTDVEWWLREKIQQMNYTTWFHPSVSIFRGGESPFAKIVNGEAEDDNTIKYGNLLHVDFGVTALGMNTDTQHMAYVLYPGQTEDDIPRGFLDGLKKANRMQDIVKDSMEIGVGGDEILRRCREQMAAEGIEGKVYSHPIGDWGHSAGTVIGMTNLQDGVPVVGQFPLLPNTFYSVELFAEHFVPEKNATFVFPLEEDVWYDEGYGWSWVYQRQERFHVIKSPKKSVLQTQYDL